MNSLCRRTSTHLHTAQLAKRPPCTTSQGSPPGAPPPYFELANPKTDFKIILRVRPGITQLDCRVSVGYIYPSVRTIHGNLHA